jgi:proliferating cell nuclear antigen PCNA
MVEKYSNLNRKLFVKKMLFRVKSDSGHVFKMLSELIQQSMKQTYFTIDEKGLSMRVTDAKMWTLFDLQLHSDNFMIYEFNHTEPIKIGLNLKHLYKMVKSMKKRDTIEFFIDNKNLENFGIRVTPRENNRISESFIKIHEYQMIDIELPGEYEGGLKYNRPINILSNDFQKMIKDLCSISSDIRITSTAHVAKFSCMVDEVLSKQISFGGDIHEHMTVKEPIIYTGEFDIIQILTIIKIAGLSRQIQLYCTQGLPILLKTQVGNIGELRIYVKSKEMIESEQHEI